MTDQYNSDSIEVLSGLEPVRRRPGMYTDTTRPNHLGQEVIDNSVDEALAGHAQNIQLIFIQKRVCQGLNSFFVNSMPVVNSLTKATNFLVVFTVLVSLWLTRYQKGLM